MSNINNTIIYYYIQYKKNNSTNFKGSISPEFINYVEELRKDCLATVPEISHKLINNTCDGLKECSKTVMEKCFHPNSILTIEILPEGLCDILLVKNDIINKHIGTADDQGFLTKRGSLKPIKRLLELQDWIKGDWNQFFPEASGKIFFWIQTTMGYSKISCKEYEYSIEAVQDVVNVLKWGRGRLNLIPSLVPNIPAENMVHHENWREEIIKDLEKRIEDLNKYNQKQSIKQSKQV